MVSMYTKKANPILMKENATRNKARRILALACTLLSQVNSKSQRQSNLKISLQHLEMTVPEIENSPPLETLKLKIFYARRAMQC